MVPLTAALRVSKEDGRRVGRALAASYLVIVPRILRGEVGSRLGMSSPAYTRAERGMQFYLDLARELQDWDRNILNYQDPIGRSIRKVEREHIEEAASELIQLVRRMPPPVRIVCEMRACGVSWRRICAELPDRAYFSMMEDNQRAVGTLHLNHGDIVRRVAG
jgi:hypothetical protein